MILKFEDFLNESNDDKYYLSLYAPDDDIVCYGAARHKGKQSAEKDKKEFEKTDCKDVKIHKTEEEAKKAAEKLLAKYDKKKVKKF